MKLSLAPLISTRQRIRFYLALSSLLCIVSGQSHALDANKEFVKAEILGFCDVESTSTLGSDLQTRCRNLVQAPNRPLFWTQLTPEQTASQNTQALEMNNNSTSTISNRLNSVKCKKNKKKGLDNAGCSDNRVTLSQLFNLGNETNKGAAGDEEGSGLDKLSIYANGNIGFGDRITTANEKGYNLDSHGTTVGADYRFNDNFIMGTAFNYENASSRFTNDLGKLETDKYSGIIYGSFFSNNGFFVDGIFSGSQLNYSNTRHIQYVLTGNTDSVNTNAIGNNQGNQFNVAMTTGFNFNFKGLTITPQIRVNYATSEVDAVKEQQGQGWELNIDQQHFESLQTAPGVRASYAISTPWAVIMPMVRAEYVHEFQNDSRTITAYFLQDSQQRRFNIVTDKPDRDFINLSAGMSAQFAHGLSAFVVYDTIQAQRYVNNHNFTGGVRFQLAF
jgi:uncharacterized protein with beta-barrel porin domain